MLVERMQHYVFPSSAVAHQTLNNVGKPQSGLTLQMDLDSSFRLFGIVLWNLGVAAGNGFDGQVALRFARPDGRFMQRILTSSNLLMPGTQYNFTGNAPSRALVSPVYPNVVFPPGSVLTVDLIGLPSAVVAPQGFVLIFVGTKIFNEGEIWAPRYPAKFRALSYLDNLFVQFSLAQLPVLDIPFIAEEADFVWQAGSYVDIPAGVAPPTTINQFADLGIQVRDFAGKSYSNGYVPVPLLFPFLGSENPGFLYPEIYIPRHEMLFFDFDYLT